MSGLDLLQAEVARALGYQGDEPANWVPARDGVDHDVAIIGAGQSGLSTAFALRQAGIGRVTVLDAAAAGGTGAWSTKARMNILRTAKRSTGPELGVPALSYQAWYEAQHGEAAYSALKSIARTDWAAYIDWYAQQVAVPVRHNTRLLRIAPDPASGLLRLHLASDGREHVETVRKVVLATGAVGGGEPFVPALFSLNLPRARYVHTDEPLSPARWAGQRVAVVGAAAAAFDAASVALENGAAEVHLFCRATDLQRTATGKNSAYPGAGNFFFDLPDADRWRLSVLLRGRSPGPPPDTVARATRFENFHLHLDAPIDAVSDGPDGVGLLSRGERFEADLVVLGTGYRIDPGLRPELAGVREAIARWRDVLPLPAHERQLPLADYPYLDAAYGFTEKKPGDAPWLRHVHCFNFAAVASFGRHVGDVASLATGVPRLVTAIARDLFVQDGAAHVARMRAPPPEVFSADAYAGALWSGATADVDAAAVRT